LRQRERHIRPFFAVNGRVEPFLAAIARHRFPSLPLALAPALFSVPLPTVVYPVQLAVEYHTRPQHHVFWVTRRLLVLDIVVLLVAMVVLMVVMVTIVALRVITIVVMVLVVLVMQMIRISWKMSGRLCTH